MGKRSFLLSIIFTMAIFFSLILTSCNGVDEPDARNLNSEVSYYIIGDVYSDGIALEGVTVKVDDGKEVSTDVNGTFKLELPGKGEYNISFSKTGYVKVFSDVVFEDNNNRSIRLLNQILVKKNNPVRVEPDKDTELKLDNVSLFIPAGALKEATDISITPFIPGSNNTNQLSILALNFEPSGLKFDKPVELTYQPAGSGSISSDGAKHLVYKDGVLNEIGDVTYDNDNNVYKASLNNFSDHVFSITVTTTSSPAGTYIYSIPLDNLSGSGNANLPVNIPYVFWDFYPPGLDVVSYIQGLMTGHNTSSTPESIAANIASQVSTSDGGGFLAGASTIKSFNITVPKGNFTEVLVYREEIIKYIPIETMGSNGRPVSLGTIPIVLYKIDIETISYDHYHIGGWLQ